MRCVLTPPLMLMVVALHLLLAGTRDQSMFRVYESDNLPKRASPCAGLETGHFQDHSQRIARAASSVRPIGSEQAPPEGQHQQAPC